MDDNELGSARPSGTESRRIEDILRVVTVVLVVAVLGAGGFFGYTVWETRRAESESTPAQRALVALQQEVRQDPNNAAKRVRLGEALAAAGLLDQAAEQFQAALKIDETHTGAWLDLGLVAMRADDPAAAEKYFVRVVELTEGAEYENINQRRELALFHLGEIALDARRFEDAAANFKAALRIRRDSSTTYYLLAQSFRGLGSDAPALENLDAALAFDPNYAEAHFLYGEILLDQDDRVNAAVHLRRAAELAPDVSAPRERLALLGSVDDAITRSKAALDEGSHETAIEEALLARALEPSSVEAGLAHARALMLTAEKDAARTVLEEVLELDSGNAEAEKMLAGLGG